MQLPLFEFNINYKEHKGGSYRFELLSDISFVLFDLLENENEISFCDYKGREWMHIDKNVLTIHKGYAWNGATPKWWIPIIKKWIGTPDPEPTRLATLIHDALFQFCRTGYFPFDVNQCNVIFYEIMKQNNFNWCETYFGAVKDFGERFIGKYPSKGEYSVLIQKSN